MSPTSSDKQPPVREPDLAELRVIWVSPSYGYGGDLLYFKGIFSAFCSRFPATQILVDPKVGYREADLLPLKAGLEGWIIQRSRKVGDADYDASVHVPKPTFITRLLASRPDVVVTIEFTMVALAAVALARVTRKFPVLLLVESDPAARGGSLNPFVRAVKRWACRNVDIIQTCNEAGRKFLIETLEVAPEKVRVAPYLTSCPQRPIDPVPATPAGRLRILFANSLTLRKGAGTLLEALALLPGPIARRIAVTIVGDGPERVALEQQAAGLTDPPIAFVGAKPYSELGHWYANADVLVAPSHADYRSLSGFEGLGYGLALIASNADGASRETLDGGRTGIGVDPGDAAGIAAAIVRFVEDPQFLSECRSNAASLFNAHFSFEQIADNLSASLAATWRAHKAKAAARAPSMQFGKSPSSN